MRRSWGRYSHSCSGRNVCRIGCSSSVSGWIQLNALCPIPVQGLTEAVEVFELVGAAALRQRFQARAAQGLTRFAGCGSVHDVCRAMSQTSLGRASHR